MKQAGLPRILAAGLRAGLTGFSWQEPGEARHVAARAFGLQEEAFARGSRHVDVIPGGSGAQLCAHAGHALRGWPGAAAALIGYCLPGLTAMACLGALWPDAPGEAGALLSAPWPDAPASSALLPGALRGLAAAAPGLALWAGMRLLSRVGRSLLSWGIAAACAGLFFLGLKPFSMLLGGAAVAVFLAPEPFGLPDPPPATPYRWSLPAGLFVGFAALAGGLFLLDAALGRVFMASAKADAWGLGGFGTVGLLFADTVRLRHWLEPQVFAPVAALAQAVPGPASAMAAFAGFRAGGLAGAGAASAAACLSSLFLFLTAAPAARLIASSAWAAKAALGVRAVLAGLCVGLAGLFVAPVSGDSRLLVLAVASALLPSLRVPPAAVALLAALLGAWLHS